MIGVTMRNTDLFVEKKRSDCYNKLTILIPCYNEPDTINTLVKLLLNEKMEIDIEIIIIDDGSDEPVKKNISPEFLSNPIIRLYRLKKNCGKGSAVRFGLKKSTGDLVLIHDADLEYHPADIHKLLKPIMEMKSLVVFGTRFSKISQKMSIFHRMGNEILTKILNLFFHSNITDMETGYKLLRKDLIDALDLKATEFEIEPEITGKLLMKGVRIEEKRITYRYRIRGISKINIGDGVDALIMIFLLRFFKTHQKTYLYVIFKRHFKKILTFGRNLIRGSNHRNVYQTI